MTSTTPVPAEEPALPALATDEPLEVEPARPATIGALPIALITIIILLFIAAAWSLVAAGG